MAIRQTVEVEVPVDIVQVFAEFKRAAELNQQMLAMNKLIVIVEKLVLDYANRGIPLGTQEVGSTSSLTAGNSDEAPKPVKKTTASKVETSTPVV